MPSRLLTEASKRRQALLAREDAAVAQIVRAYGQTEQILRRQLEEVLGKIAERQLAGQPFTPAWLYQTARLRQMLNQTKEQVDRFSAQALDIVGQEGRRSVQFGLVDAISLTQVALGQEPNLIASFATIGPEQITTLASFFAPDGPLRALFDPLGKETADLVESTIISGTAAGFNPRKIRRALVGTIAKPGPLFHARTRAERTARTEAIRAYRETKNQQYTESKVVKKWRWHCTRTRRTCAMCLAMDGQEFDTETRMATHPQCRCAMIPVTDLTPAPAVSGAEFLRVQDPRDQDHILGGKAAGELYRSGKVELRDFVHNTRSRAWGPGRRQKSLAQMIREGTITRQDVVAAAKAARLTAKPATVPIPAPPVPIKAPKATRPIPVKTAAQPVAKRTPKPKPEPKAPALPVKASVGDRFRPDVGPRQTEHLQAYQQAIRGLDQVLANIPEQHQPIPVKFPWGDGDSLGAMQYQVKFEAGKPRFYDQSIEIYESVVTTDRMALTVVHEMGHAIDQALGERAGLMWASAYLPDLQGWRMAVFKSKAFKSLKKVGGDVSHDLHGYAQYLMECHELWARCMEQYVAHRAGDPSMLATWKFKKVNDELIGIQRFWDTEDFEPIAAELHKAFKQMGIDR